MNFDCVIFDLDGTLTASEEGILKSASYAIEKLGYAVPPYETLRKFIGPPIKYSFLNYVGMTEEDTEKAITVYRERYGTIGWAENRVYEGIPLILKRLKRAGVHLGIATGKPQLFTDKIVELFGLKPYFETVCGISQTDHTADKKHLITSAIHAGCTKIAMVGDRKFDMEAAKALGFTAIGVQYGYGTKEELEAAGADVIAKDTRELMEILAGDLPAEQGIFISMEGSDGCGKTTQTKFFTEWLKKCGWSVKTTREPGGSPISEAIRSLVLDPSIHGMTNECEAYLFAASRAQHVRDTIRPALAEGKIVLCDRFVDSSAAFQGEGRGMGLQSIQEINRIAIDGTMPDMTLFLNIDPDTAMRRRLSESDPDRIEAEGNAFARRVYNAFVTLQAQDPERIIDIPATGTPDEVQSLIRAAAMKRISSI